MRSVPHDFEARRAALHARRDGAEPHAGPPMRARPSRIIAEQQAVIAEQEALIELLKGALAAAGEEIPAYHPWMKGLTPQERAVLGALYRCYPRPVNKDRLLDLMPGHDHVEDRCAQLVVVKVCHLRKKLGAGAIERVAGLGYRLSGAQHAAMQPAADPAALKLVA